MSTRNNNSTFNALPYDLKALVHEKIEQNEQLRWLQVSKHLRQIALIRGSYGVKVDEITIYVFFNVSENSLKVEEPRFFLKKSPQSQKQMFDGNGWGSLFKNIRFVKKLFVQVLWICDVTRPKADIRDFSVKNTFPTLEETENLKIRCHNIMLLKMIFEGFSVKTTGNVEHDLPNPSGHNDEIEFREKLLMDVECSKLTIRDAFSAFIIQDFPVNTPRIELFLRNQSDTYGKNFPLDEEKRFIASLFSKGLKSPNNKYLEFCGQNIPVPEEQWKEVLESIDDKEPITDKEMVLKFAEEFSEIAKEQIQRFIGFDYPNFSVSKPYWECFHRRIDQQKRCTVFFSFASARPIAYVKQELVDDCE